MVKRLSDSTIWSKDWFLDLTDKQKLLVKFLFDNCDCAGVYEISARMLRTCFNSEITKADFEGIKQVKFISDNKIFIEDFIKFQYNTSIPLLNPLNRVHKGILKCLEKHNLLTLTKQLPNCTGVGVGVGIGVGNIINVPTKKQIEDFCKLVAKKIDIDEFMNWYSASGWKDKEGLPINWQQKVLSWAKRDIPKEEPKSPYRYARSE